VREVVRPSAELARRRAITELPRPELVILRVEAANNAVEGLAHSPQAGFGVHERVSDLAKTVLSLA
jgi:hypothetical protein